MAGGFAVAAHGHATGESLARPGVPTGPAPARRPGNPGAAPGPRPSADTAELGLVTLVGAGPGDPGLVTARGRERLAEADVVVADRLVPHSLLATLRPEVRVVDVSKQPRGAFVPQERINEILIAEARAGHRVVRFKGGDPFVFGRGMEEVQACRAAGVPVEVVPGVSSAIAVPELAGVPVTHRGLTQGFTVVSAHLPPGDPGSTVDWAGVAAAGTTIVLLMAVHTLPEVTAALLAHGLDPATPAASVENGGTERQRVLTGRLADIAEVAAAHDLHAPAVTVIGEAAAFASPTPPGHPRPRGTPGAARLAAPGRA
ncbi:uroporphyrinogen-III C-methyltransferase [Natronosporangium hydrolyticum]|uniref:uroporphyrinogen-III C-methyltransferase n=1 Tax=Natronosporangium hydrolyticum TaxID=2811111 RepID=UPI0023BA738F|nr:uroporphyrinogen-III C-methyltransferase [Natronosporangium hydrolyticum]